MRSSREELRARVRAAEHDEKQLVFLRGQVARLTPIRDERALALRSEGRDVEELEEFSLDGLFMKWLGTKEACLERERRELVEARLRHAQVEDELAQLRTRVTRLEASAAERLRAHAEYDAACAEHAERLAARGGTQARRVAELDQRIDGQEVRLHELGEALTVCKEAQAELAHLVEVLGDAWGYAITDLFSVGPATNFHSEYGKRTYLNQAHGHMTHAADALRRLEGEILDTGLRIDLRQLIPAGMAVGDWWLDSLLMDWLTQRRISEARARARDVLAVVADLATRLQNAESACEGELARDRRLLEEQLES